MRGSAQAGSVSRKSGFQGPASVLLTARVVFMKTERRPPCSKFRRLATLLAVWFCTACFMSAASAAKTASSGEAVPSGSALSSGALRGSCSATSGSCTLLTSISPMGTRKVNSVKTNSGSTSA